MYCLRRQNPIKHLRVHLRWMFLFQCKNLYILFAIYTYLPTSQSLNMIYKWCFCGYIDEGCTSDERCIRHVNDALADIKMRDARAENDK